MLNSALNSSNVYLSNLNAVNNSENSSKEMVFLSVKAYQKAKQEISSANKSRPVERSRLATS